MTDTQTTPATTKIEPRDGGFQTRLHVAHQSFDIGYVGTHEEALFMQNMLVKALTKAGITWQQ